MTSDDGLGWLLTAPISEIDTKVDKIIAGLVADGRPWHGRSGEAKEELWRMIRQEWMRVADGL